MIESHQMKSDLIVSKNSKIDLRKTILPAKDNASLQKSPLIFKGA
jgi:hypothetical protein